MAVDSPSPAASAGRVFPDDALSSILSKIQKKLGGATLPDDDESTAFDSRLKKIYIAISIVQDYFDGCPESLVDIDQFLENVKKDKKRGSRFIDSLREAVNGNDWTLWGPVVTHGACIGL